ncbi:MAG: hypothetical protein IBJ00_03225, partial [Alphaproteobacteria bacterium]|nr:hypothetical protein [Alphaproteobacteria bacterium]
VTGENIRLELEEGLERDKIIEISFAQIQKAKLIPDFKSTKLSREN